MRASLSRCAGPFKTTTGLVGLPVNRTARADAIAVHTQLLEAVQVLPADVGYRRSVEKMARDRLALLNGPANLVELEKQLEARFFFSGAPRRPRSLAPT